MNDGHADVGHEDVRHKVVGCKLDIYKHRESAAGRVREGRSNFFACQRDLLPDSIAPSRPLPCKKKYKCMFSESFVIAILAVLDRFWRGPSWAILARFGLQNEGENALKIGRKTAFVCRDSFLPILFVSILRRSWGSGTWTDQNVILPPVKQLFTICNLWLPDFCCLWHR